MLAAPGSAMLAGPGSAMIAAPGSAINDEPGSAHIVGPDSGVPAAASTRQSLQINVIVHCHCLHKWHFILDILPHPLCFMQYCFAGALVLSKLEMLDWHNIYKFVPSPLDNFDTFRQISESFYCVNYQIVA